MLKAIRWSLPAFIICGMLVTLGSCTSLELYERSVPLPGHQWKSEYTPSFDFIITDTTARYDVSLVFRHRDRYHYNNLWLQLSITDPQGKNYSYETDLLLGTNESGWLGAGMDDIYEHRISLQKDLVAQGVSLRKAGTYQFRIKQLMREDPLEEVMNVGIRIEKKP
jgi:gliding motility-associated lipoprotein GldH